MLHSLLCIAILVPPVSLEAFAIFPLLRTTTTMPVAGNNHHHVEPKDFFLGHPNVAIDQRTWSRIDRPSRLWSSSSSSKDDSIVLPDVSSMRIGDIRQELESYGISTKSFLEKKELIAALEKARAEGKTPVKEPKKPTTAAEAQQTGGGSTGTAAAGQKNDTSRTSTDSTSSSNPTTPEDRSKRLAEEMKKANAMKVGELKKALQEFGVSTKSLFEKSEFVKAYAEAIVDGVKEKSKSSSSSSGGGTSRGTTTTTTTKDEPSDPDYRTVVMQKMPKGDPRMLQGVVIDVIAR